MNQWITNAKLIVTAMAFVAALATIGYEWRYGLAGPEVRAAGRMVGPEGSPVPRADADLADHQSRRTAGSAGNQTEGVGGKLLN